MFLVCFPNLFYIGSVCWSCNRCRCRLVLATLVPRLFLESEGWSLMFLCDEPGQPGQIDLSARWLRRGRGGWGGGAEGEVEQEMQVIVSLGVELDLSVIWQNREGKKKEQKKAYSSHSKLLAALSRRRGNRKGKYWPKAVWFVLLREWMGSSVLIRHTALLVIPAIPLLWTKAVQSHGFIFILFARCENARSMKSRQLQLSVKWTFFFFFTQQKRFH